MKPITTREEVERLREQGWEVPELPKDSEEAFERHRESKQKTPVDTPFIVKAEEELEDRFRRVQVPVGGYYARNANHQDWVEDRKEKERDEFATKNSDWRKRKPEAAGVSGLLGTTVIPPYGYRGDIRELVKQRLLPEDEMMVYDSNEHVRKRYSDEHEKAFDRRVSEMTSEVQLQESNHTDDDEGSSGLSSAPSVDSENGK